MLKSHHMTVRTRMAPSPTGEYHIGGMRTLLYNYALAKKEGGQFILRIEDTDRERLVEGAADRLIQVIRDYGLDWDEGPLVGGPYAPYVQSERLDIYKKYTDQLINSGNAYYCFCTKERLGNLREEQQAQGAFSTKYDKYCLKLSKEEVQEKLNKHEEYVVRLNVPKDGEVSFDDKILGHISFPTNDIDDQILIKSDGFPTYHLAVVVDDFLMKINCVMRGMEWLPSTPKHILLYKAFGWEIPSYAHLPLLKEQGDTKKLSKRMGSVAAVEFLSEGYLPQALLNFLMFLGWNPGGEKEIYSMGEFIKEFSVEKVHKTDLIVFDRQKLLWTNGYYIRNMSNEDLLDVLIKWGEKFNIELNGLSKSEKPKEFNLKVLALIKDRMKTLSDFNLLTGYFYSYPQVEKELLLSYTKDRERASDVLESFYEEYKNIDENNWALSNLEETNHRILESKKYLPKEAFMTIRVAVTGSTATPSLVEILELLGKKEIVSRIEKSIAAFK
jgi:glutamyl-tRNA synthetase